MSHTASKTYRYYNQMALEIIKDQGVIREILKLIHSHSELSSVTTTNSPTVTFTGDGSVGNPLVATAIGGVASNPGGSDTQVQYNNAGVFGADAGFTYINAAKAILLTNGTNTGTFTPNGSQYTGSAQTASYTKSTIALNDSGTGSSTNVSAGLISITNSGGGSTSVQMDGSQTSSATVMLPNTTGTIALKSDYSLSAVLTNGNTASSHIILTGANVYGQSMYTGTGVNDGVYFNNGGTNTGYLKGNILTANRNWSLPDTSGEVVVNNNFLSNLKGYVNWGKAIIAVSPSTSVYTVAHNSGWIPSPTSFAITFSDASDTNLFQSHRSIDANNITITCINPPTFTGNVTIYWQTFR